MACNLNCYGDSATPVPLPGGDGNGVPADTLETCRDFCLGTDGCEAVVFGQKMCYGKKDVHTGKCQPSDGDFVTEIINKLPLGTCVIMGDPHILTFDNPLGAVEDNTQLVAGDYTVVSTDVLTIQGRFGYSDRFPSEASLAGLTVTGDILKGQKLTVEYRGPDKGTNGFKAWWNEQEIVTSLPSDFKSDDGLVTAQRAMMNPDDMHHSARHTIGGEAGSGDLPSFFFSVQPGIEIYILMGDQTMNAVITMHRMPGAFDGYCGNFNCNAADDTMMELEKRGLAAPVTQTLFTQPPLTIGNGDAKGAPTINDCPADVLATAQEECAQVAEGLREGCIYDVCVSGSASMGKEDAMTASIATEMGEKFTTFLGLQFPRLTTASLAPHLQWMLVVGVAGVAATGFFAGISSRQIFSTSNGYRPAGDEDDEEALLMPVAGEHDVISGAE